MLMMLFFAGLLSNGFSVYQPYIISENGFSNTLTSRIITVKNLASFAAMLLTGAYYKQLSLRTGIAAAGFIGAAGLLLFGLAKSVPAYFAAAILTGTCYGLGSTIPMAILVKRWFVGRRKTVLGICSAMTGLSTIGFPSLLTHILTTGGLMPAFLLHALLTLLVSIACLLLLKDDPSEEGLTPYGIDEASAEPQKTGAGPGLTRSEWILAYVMLLCLGGVGYTGVTHLAVLFSGEGVSPQIAALGISFSGIVLTCSKSVFGVLSERWGMRRVNALFGALLIIGTVLCWFVKQGTFMVFLAMLFYSPGLAVVSVGVTAWGGELSAPGEYDRTVSRFLTAYMGGGLLFTILPGILADRYDGSYVPAYMIFTLCAIFGILIIRRLYRINKLG